MNAKVDAILATAQQRAQAAGVAYFGDVTPAEAWEIVQSAEDAVLVDVRTAAEQDFVGRVPGAVEISLRTYPGMLPNPDFVDQVIAVVKPEQVVIFLCRSGVRSVAAAQMLTAEGYTRAINILEGFEGDKNELGHRRVNGWKMAGLPWSQG